MKTPLNHIAPTRYYSETIEMGFWEALKRFLKHWEWSWYRVQFKAVYRGQPGYDEAPFEESIIEL